MILYNYSFACWRLVGINVLNVGNNIFLFSLHSSERPLFSEVLVISLSIQTFSLPEIIICFAFLFLFLFKGRYHFSQYWSSLDLVHFQGRFFQVGAQMDFQLGLNLSKPTDVEQSCTGCHANRSQKNTLPGWGFHLLESFTRCLQQIAMKKTSDCQSCQEVKKKKAEEMSLPPPQIKLSHKICRPVLVSQ